LRVEEDVEVTAAFRPRHSYLCDEQRSWTGAREMLLSLRSWLWKMPWSRFT
jgi:hypothetical protein